MLSECVECARCFWRYPDCMCKEGFLAPSPLTFPEKQPIVIGYKLWGKLYRELSPYGKWLHDINKKLWKDYIDGTLKETVSDGVDKSEARTITNQS